MLKKELTKLWLEIPIKMIDNLTESTMPRRLQACIKNNGRSIPY